MQDNRILPHYRRLNDRFNKMANQYKSIFQDIIQVDRLVYLVKLGRLIKYLFKKAS